MTDKQANNITKEQAIRILHPDTRVEAIDDYDEAGNYEHAYDTAILMAIAALNEVGSPTTQLDENGLMLCGCGGKATRSYSSIGCVVFCASCGLSTKNTFFASEAVNAWNVAMGYRA